MTTPVGFIPPFTLGADATTENVDKIPKGLLPVGYTTGAGVAWSVQQFQERPNALRIVQDFGSDVTADYIDMETGAATPEDCARWYPKALESYHAGRRPGQKHPGIYASMNNITPLVNHLISVGITSGPFLIIAKWGISQASAEMLEAAAGGPFPVVGMQIANDGPYDFDVYDTAWIMNASHSKDQPPPGQWNQVNPFVWREAEIVGTNLGGIMHSFRFAPGDGHWFAV